MSMSKGATICLRTNKRFCLFTLAGYCLYCGETYTAVAQSCRFNPLPFVSGEPPYVCRLLGSFVLVPGGEIRTPVCQLSLFTEPYPVINQSL